MMNKNYFIFSLIFVLLSLPVFSADRYWVGGTGDWDSIAGSKWSSTSGGIGGVSIPSSSDNVFFDNNSGNVQVTLSSDVAYVKSVSFISSSGNFTGNFSQTGGSLTFYSGNVTYSPNMIMKSSSYGLALGSGTVYIKSNGIPLPIPISVSGGGGYVLMDNLNLTGKTITISTGNFETNGYNVTASSISIAGSGTKIINLTNSYLKLSSFSNTATAGVNFISTGSTIETTGTSTNLNAGSNGLVFYNVKLTGVGTQLITGNNSFNDLNFTPYTPAKDIILNIAGDIKINNQFTLDSGAVITRRILVKSSVIGTTRNIGINTISFNNADFEDIAFNQSINLSSITGYSGDCGGNTNITFTPPLTVYWKSSGCNTKAFTSDCMWFLGTNGTGGAGRVPLCQDTAIFDNNSIIATGETIVQDLPRIGNVNWSGVTNNPTFTTSTTSSIFGNVILSPNMILTSSTQTYSFEGRNNYYLDSANLSWSKPLYFNCVNGSYTLLSNLSTSGSATITLESGTLDFNDYNLSIFRLDASGTKLRTLYSGNGFIYVYATDTNPLWFTLSTNLNFYSENSTYISNGILTTDLTFAGGNMIFNNILLANRGNFAITVSGSNIINQLSVNTGTIVKFTAGTTQKINNFSITGNSTLLNKISSTTTANAFLNYTGSGKVVSDYLNISDITVSPAYTWFAGSHSINSSDTNWLMYGYPNIPTTGTPTLNSPVYNNNTAICTPVNNSDLDGDTVTNTFRWFKNDTLISGQVLSTLTNSEFNHYDIILCEATPFDGTLYGEAKNSSSITIQNTAPLFTQTNISVTFPARSDFSLQINVTDLDSDTLTYYIIDQTEEHPEVSINPSTGLITRPMTNGSLGSASFFTVNVTDGSQMISTWVLLNMTDSFPNVLATTVSPLVIHANDEVKFNLTCSDTDDDFLYYLCELYNGTSSYSITFFAENVNNSNFNICSVPADVVKSGETWTAQLGCSYAPAWFPYSVYPNATANISTVILNSAPIFSETNISVTFPARSDFSLQINVTDLDSDTLTYSISEFYDGGQFDPIDYNNSLHTFNIDSVTGLLTRTATNGSQATWYKYSINVTDGTDMVSTWLYAGMTDSYADVNWFSEIPNPTFRDNQIDYNLTCVDSDDDDIYYICQIYNGTQSYSSMVATLYANNSNVNICSLPSNTANKGETWKAQLGCSLFNDFFDTDEIWGNPNGTVNTTGLTIENTVPTFTGTDFTYSGLDNESISIQLNATDIDLDTLTFASNNSMFSVDSNSGLITDNNLVAGTYTVQYSVFDGEDYDYLTITFTINESNTAPTIVSTYADYEPSHTNDELLFSVTCTDLQSSTITAYCQIYNGTETYDGISALNISIDIMTQICTVPINIVKKGENWKAEFYCSDSFLNSARQNTSTLTIQNTAPTFITSGFTYEGQTLETISILITATDIDLDTLTFASNNSMFPVDSNSGLIIDNNLVAGTYTVQYSVFDGEDYDYIDVTFNIAISNTAPFLGSTSAYPVTAYKDTQINFAVLCTDTTNSSFTGYCQIYNDSTAYGSLDSSIVLNNTMTDVCFLPSNTASRGQIWKALLSCGDGEFNSSASYSNTVTIGNRQPSFTQSNFTYTASATQSFTLQINATDPDSDTLTYSINDSRFTINSATGLINRTGQGSNTAGTYNTLITISDGLLSNEMWITFDLTQNSPVVTISNPLNESTQRVPFLITFKVIDPDTSTTDCTIYIDDSLSATLNSVINNTDYNVDEFYSIGNHNVYVSCTDGTVTSSSGKVYFYYDDTAIIISPVLPNTFNTTTFNGYTMNIRGTVTASNLTLVSRTLYYPNNSIFFNEEITSFVDVTTYSWNNTFDTHSYPNGIYSMNIYAEDYLSNTANREISFTIQNCVPQWICNAYDSCGIDDKQSCNGVTDSQSCGLTYTGDYSEFSDMTCNYCSANIVLVNQTLCLNGTTTLSYQDLNFDSCCSVTGFGSDCYENTPQNNSIVSVDETCSEFEYESGDIVKAVYDGIVRFILEIGKWIGGK